MSKVLTATSLAELDEIIDGNTRVVVDFHGESWCLPCRKLSPHFSAAAEQVPGVTFVKVDIDQAEDIREQYAIRGVPMVYLFEDGEFARDISERTVLGIIRDLS